MHEEIVGLVWHLCAIQLGIWDCKICMRVWKRLQESGLVCPHDRCFRKKDKRI